MSDRTFIILKQFKINNIKTGHHLPKTGHHGVRRFCLAQKDKLCSIWDMPRLIVQRHGRPLRKIPPCGRRIEYVEPRSPFQKLVNAAMHKQRMSGRSLALMVTDAAGNPTSQSTLWIWLHNTNGFPHPKSFGESHLRTLARAIKVPVMKLREALDASRHLYTPNEDPMPHKLFDAFARFIEIMENDKRHMLSRSYVINIAKTLRNGAKVDR